jgi:microcystin degradation protein MlrC
LIILKKSIRKFTDFNLILENSMKVFLAGLATETNMFSPVPTGLSDFIEEPCEGLTLLATLAKERAWKVAKSLNLAAMPAGPTARGAYESMRDKILADLNQAMPVDIVLLSLHGAMIAYGYEDCEGDLLQRVREITGPTVKIGALLDPHCHMTDVMVDNATVLVCLKEYPHIDERERAKELFELLANAAERKTSPVTSVVDCRMLSVYMTSLEPMKSFVARLHELEKEPGILHISVVHGFPWADVPDMGTKMLVITDNDKARGEKLAKQLGKELFALRGQTMSEFVPLKVAFDQAEAAEAGPVVIADWSVAAGGGAPGDSTLMLQEVLKRNLKNTAVGMIWDPLSVDICMNAGVGAELNLRIGGKSCSFSGDPIDLDVTVTAIKPDMKQIWTAPTTFDCGDAVAVRAGDLDIVLHNIRIQTYGPDVFTQLGIDPAQKKVLVIKAALHYKVNFAGLITADYMVATPGVMNPNFLSIPYKRLKRPKWPFDENPFMVL